MFIYPENKAPAYFTFHYVNSALCFNKGYFFAPSSVWMIHRESHIHGSKLTDIIIKLTMRLTPDHQWVEV